MLDTFVPKIIVAMLAMAMTKIPWVVLRRILLVILLTVFNFNLLAELAVRFRDEEPTKERITVMVTDTLIIMTEIAGVIFLIVRALH